MKSSRGWFFTRWFSIKLSILCESRRLKELPLSIFVAANLDMAALLLVSVFLPVKKGLRQDVSSIFDMTKVYLP